MYQPDEKILENYANVLVRFALGGGRGIKKGDAVFIQVPESAKAVLNPLVISVLQAGGHPIINYTPEGTDRWLSADRVFFDHADEGQIKYTPRNYYLGRIKDCDHFVAIIATNNKRELAGVDSAKIMARQQAIKYYKDARDEKENRGQLTWTLALFGTPAMAREAGLSLSQYWEQIIKACFLDQKDPIARWRSVFRQIEELREKLDQIQIEEVRVKGRDVDLRVKLGRGRRWLGGSGRNIPSFELFTSPDWRGTTGWVKFNQPLYRYGNLVEGIELEFAKGKVVKAGARKNEKLLREMIKVKNADKVGEFSLTDRRFSRIDKFMAETLFDENMGGKFGNFHIALGSAYKDAYPQDPAKIKQADWERLGYNDSVVHTDLVSTTNRKVIAVLARGGQKVIYEDGQFVL